MLIRAAISLTFALVLLSGCTSSQNASDASTPHNSTPTPTEPPTTSPPPTETKRPFPSIGEAPRSFELTDCINQESTFDWPSTTAPGNTPPGWEGSGPHPGSDYRLKFFQCHRFFLGGFERLINITIEGHNKGASPEACHNTGDYDVFTILERLWIDDEEIATWLSATYGLPARYAAITYTDSTVGAAHERTWTITPPGAQPSTMTFTPEPVGPEKQSEFGMRLVWWNGTVLGLMDWPEKYSYNDPGINTAYGHFEPPMLHASTATKEWIGGGNWLRGMNISGQIYLWGDTLCEQPL